ncbi:MAG: site-2 protease family protein, partial [Candidatus Thermoplasmatota archaeon]|nr:site-2 protease family protein [Candidatus Thermoplasmatota archaeon]
VYIGTPLLFDALAWPFDVPTDAIIHPVALAGWVGLLVTGINLLPTGQLDGGHVATAWLGDHARALSALALGILVLLGLGIPPFAQEQWIPGYGGWLVFAIIILFLGTQHPPTLNSISELDTRRTALAIVTFVLAVVCFTPLPISV